VKDFLKSLKINENLVSTGMGVVVVVLAGVLLLNFFRSAQKATDTSDRTSSTATETSSEAAAQPADGAAVESKPAVAGGEYTVQEGDSLWKIAENAYGSGYAWTKIYDANKDVIGQNPSTIETGTKLNLPGGDIAVAEHTVVKGDNLWNISARYCGTGFAWTTIAARNNLPNPRLIEPGLKLTIACR
jgi:nucleoid-associated protein YgaU